MKRWPQGDSFLSTKASRLLCSHAWTHMLIGVEKVVISMVHVTAVSFAIMTVALTGRISNLALRVKGTIVDAAKSHSLSRAGSSLKHDTPNPNAEPAGEDRSIPVGTQLNLNNVPILDGCTPTPMGCISAGIKNRQDQLLWNPRTISALKIAPHAATTHGPGEAEGYMIVALENKGQYNGRAVGGFASRAVKQ
eukprot:scaffold96394_cov41-Tisochrysis_lutea.AAC.1